MKKIIVLVLDGFGIGYMDDVSKVRPKDIGSNTALHIFSEVPLSLPNLEKLGLMNAIGIETNEMKFSKSANFGKANLKHYGADTFFGHQEIMGTNPKQPLRLPFSACIDEVLEDLIKNNYNAKKLYVDDCAIISINDEVFIGDNLETDLGQVYNITTSFNYITFKEVKKIAMVVRNVAKVARVIVFGGEDVTKKDLLDAIETKENKYIGVNAPKSKVYNKGYLVEHLGYGVDYTVQVQTQLYEQKQIKTGFIGKVADICNNTYGESHSIVDTKKVMEKTIELIKENNCGFICANVQETDLAGHAEDSIKYANKLAIADTYIKDIINLLTKDDILIVMADHGNDPTVGHSKHTRERVPLLIFKKDLKGKNIGCRNTLADVGATVAEFHNINKLDFGDSFLKILT
ncbi:phosphopentomutase [Candidatus Izimaplasma bacterium ZiA1]|uniref:phosphopentomutase n=1 Tax=Candidatus Izimoplasma sp. ZiA1 TaxID=2024899 RepID=UPI000BAA8D63|nr:phosphopentomutase [Candidatus Izimaplasma bacterium ZiA1]